MSKNLERNRNEQYLDDSIKLKQDLYTEFFTKILSSLPPTQFETFGHPVAGVIAISSRSKNPIETLSSLYRQSHDPEIPDYINKDYLRYYVLVHDEQGDNINESIALFEKMKRNFGLHCHMIRINRPFTEEESEVIPDTVWKPVSTIVRQENNLVKNRILHESDVGALRIFTRELVIQSVIPFMERCIATWNDQVASSRRGITGRLFSASKKYFASSTRAATSSILSSANALGQSNTFPFSLPGSVSSPPPPPPTPPSTASSPILRGNFNVSKGSYGYLTAEAQIRKLADFAFMLRDYKFAFTTYELLKRDFHNDKAWHYLAGVQEMAAVSYLMNLSDNSNGRTNNANNNNNNNNNNGSNASALTSTLDPLLDSATYSYISRCSLPTYALRCIILSSELMCTVKSIPSLALEGSTKWTLRALNEKLVGRLCYAMLMERVSGAYEAYEQMTKSRWLTRNTTVDSNKKKSDERHIQLNCRSSRARKAGFWMLLAAREWHDANQIEQSVYCLSKADEMYDAMEWTTDPTGLLRRLKDSTMAFVPNNNNNDNNNNVNDDDNTNDNNNVEKSLVDDLQGLGIVT